METLLLTSSPVDLEKAVLLLKSDEVVALPTETVYGLAGNAYSETAITKIFKAKERPSNDPLIVHVSKSVCGNDILNNLEKMRVIDLKDWTPETRSELNTILKKYWPGPLTVILPRGSRIIDLVTSSQPTVGIRCPDHPVFQDILSRLSFPLAAPSANRFGRISPTSAAHVKEELNTKIAAIVDGGNCKVGLESTIVLVESPFKMTLLRPGKIAIGDLQLKEIQKTVTPGSLDDHYAPIKPLYLIDRPFQEFADDPKSILPKELQHKNIGLLTSSATDVSLTLEKAAAELYQKMRALDQDTRVDAILADVPSEKTGLGAAIRDRLKRASRNKPNV